MKSWPQGIGAVTLFVEDLKATKTFHREVFGLPVAFEDDDSAVFDFGNTIVNLLKTTAALELIEPAVVAGPGTGSRLQLPPPAHHPGGRRGRHVRRAGDARRDAAERPDGPPWAVRTATFTDPGGHIWEIAHRHAE